MEELRSIDPPVRVSLVRCWCCVFVVCLLFVCFVCVLYVSGEKGGKREGRWWGRVGCAGIESVDNSFGRCNK